MGDRFAPPTEDAEAVDARIRGSILPGRAAPRAAVGSDALPSGANVTAGRIASTAAVGTCDAKTHRSFRIVSNAGVADTMEVCVKLADDSYDWRTVTLT